MAVVVSQLLGRAQAGVAAAMAREQEATRSDGADLYHLVYNLCLMCPMVALTTRAIYKDGVLKPTTKLDLPDGATAEVQISALPLAVDPKDALLDDGAALQAMYSEFAEEEMF